MQVNMSLSIRRRDLQIAYSFLVRKTFHTKGENCNKLKLLPWGRDRGREMFLQLPRIIKYCSLTDYHSA